jgi:hypothetical protein
MALGVRRSLGIDVRLLEAASRSALSAPLEDEAELWIGRPAGDATVLGAFQRCTSAKPGDVVRRGTGGPSVRMGTGTVWLALVLSRVDALTSCDEAHLVNRYVRPLLRALAKRGCLAHFFGRDWVSVKHRPAAWVGFGHDAGSGRAVVEAFVARETPFDVGPRASYLGKAPGTLVEIAGGSVDESKLVDAIVEAYAGAYGRAAIDRGEVEVAGEVGAGVEVEPPWKGVVEAVIGTVGAGPDGQGVFRVGGDLLVSRDALAALEAALPAVRDEDVGAKVDEVLGARGVAVDGVRSLASVRDAVLAARGAG